MDYNKIKDKIESELYSRDYLFHDNQKEVEVSLNHDILAIIVKHIDKGPILEHDYKSLEYSYINEEYYLKNQRKMRNIESVIISILKNEGITFHPHNIKINYNQSGHVTAIISYLIK